MLVQLVDVVVALGAGRQAEAPGVVELVIDPGIADVARRGEHLLARQRLPTSGERADHLGFLDGVRAPHRPLVVQLCGELHVDAATLGFTQADGGAGARHVGHFIGSFLLPHGDARLRAGERLELHPHFLAGVDRRFVRGLAGGHVGRCGGPGEDLEGTAPVGVDVDVRGDAVHHAELGLLDPAVVLQLGFLAVHQLGITGELVDAIRRDDLQLLDGLDDRLGIGAGVVQRVAVVVLRACRRRVEIGRDAEVVAIAAVFVVLLLVVDAAVEGQHLVGAPGQVAQHAGLALFPLAALTRGIADRIAGESHGAVIVVAVVVQLVAQAQVVAELEIGMRAEVLHVAVVAIVGVLLRRLRAARGQLLRGEKTRLLGLVVVETGDHAELHGLLVIGDEPFAAQGILVGVAVVAETVGILLGQKVVLREVAFLVADGQLEFAGVEAAVGQAAVGVVAALTGGEIDVAADVVQAVARVIGAAHHLDVFQIQRENHVDETLVAAVDVARYAVDQRLDAIDVALAVERTEGHLAGLGAHARLGQLDAGHLAHQLPTVHHVLILDLVAAHDVDRGQNAVGAQRAAGLGGDVDRAERNGGVAG